MNVVEVAVRLFVAALFGAIIGSDRVLKGRPAGIKTHALVSLGAALAMITGEYISLKHGSDQEVGRLAAQVISGIGFLGAGTIMFTQNQIQGLTTAAGLWFAGTLGISIGGGFYDIGGIALLVWAFIFMVLSKLDNTLAQRNLIYKIYFDIAHEDGLLNILMRLDKLDIAITNKEALNKDKTHWIITGHLHNRQRHYDIKDALSDIEYVKIFEVYYDAL